MMPEKHGYLEKIVVGLIISVAIVVGIWILFFKSFYVTDINAIFMDHRKPLPELTGNNRIEQTFICRVPDLGKIDILPGTYRRKNSSILVVTISDDNTNENIRQMNLPCKNLPDTQLYSITFDPITTSRNRSLRLTVVSPDGKPDNAVTLWYSSKRFYNDGNLKVNSEPLDGNLVFRTAQKVSFHLWFDNLTVRIAEGKPVIFGYPVFYKIAIPLFWVLMVVFMCYIMVFLIRED